MRRRAARIILSMQARLLRIAIVAMLVVGAIPCRSSAAVCPLARGFAIVLASQELDPDVFLWDSHDRLAKYAQGDFTVQVVLKHTTLVRAYSRAVVVDCKNDAIRPTFAGRSDPAAYLVGVRITSGPSHGHYGWVLSSDVRRPDGRILTGNRHR